METSWRIQCDGNTRTHEKKTQRNRKPLSSKPYNQNQKKDFEKILV